MPNVNIHISDNTGVEVTGTETVVFIPGKIKIQDDYTDANGCTYISSLQWKHLGSILKLSEISNNDNGVDQGTLFLIEACLLNKMDVIYYYMSNYSQTNCFPKVPKDKGENNKNYFFLFDKDNYNVKFLTSGYYNIVQASGSNPNITSDGTVTGYAITGIASKDTCLLDMAYLAYKRKDCVVLASVNDDKYANNKNGDILAIALKQELNKDIIKTWAEANSSLVFNDDEHDSLLSYIYLLIPDVKLPENTLSVTTPSVKVGDGGLRMPGIYVYLQAFGKSLIKDTDWLPTANSERGYVGDYGTPTMIVTKYMLDNYIITDPEVPSTVEEGGSTSFNGIVNLRPYGNVIWGDRTAIKLENTVKATAYLSLKLLICDIAKRAYQSAVRYTYESNTDITWFNFKSRVTELLGEAVAAGVLSSFDMKKQVSDTYNKITCKITLYPNLPVENFDVYINLENAEVSTSGEDVE